MEAGKCTCSTTDLPFYSEKGEELRCEKCRGSRENIRLTSAVRLSKKMISRKRAWPKRKGDLVWNGSGRQKPNITLEG